MKNLYVKIVKKLLASLIILPETIVLFVCFQNMLILRNTCCGLLIPIDIEKYKNTYKIVYKCSKCNQVHKNIMANDDNMDKIIELSVKE